MGCGKGSHWVYPLLSVLSFDKRTKSVSEAPLTLTECEEKMLELQERYPVEYRAYGLSSVAVAIVFPLIRRQLQVSAMLCQQFWVHACSGGNGGWGSSGRLGGAMRGKGGVRG